MHRSSDMLTVHALIANVLLSWAHFRAPTGGVCDPVGVVMVLVALWLLLIGSAVNWPHRMERVAGRLTPPLLGALVVIRLVALAPYFMIESVDEGCPAPLVWFFLITVAIALASYLTGIVPPRARLPVLLAVAMAGPLWIIRSQPKPTVDVLAFQEDASRVLLSGHNPYATSYSNVYQDNTLYGPGMVRNGRVCFFPYPPLSLLVVLPAHLMGDIRYANLAALAGSCILLAATGRKRGIAPGSPYELITVALALQLDNHVIIAFGWTEPLLALGVTALSYALATARRLLVCLAIAWIVAIKQYGFLWTIPLLATREVRPRDWAIAVAAVTAVNLPFFLWSPWDFWYDLIVAQAIAPFRPDLLSVPAVVFSWSGQKMSFVWSIAAALTAVVISLRHRPLSVPRAMVGGTAIVLAFVAFSKQGAPNYLWFTSVAPLVGAVLDQRQTGSRA